MSVSAVEKEVQSLINTLGFLDKGVYYLEPDCFQNVRDLIRYLHRDDRVFTVRRLCMSHNIVKNDLVPILKTEDVDDELFDAALRLCVNLCQPTLLVFGGKLPENDPAQWQLFYELESSLVRSLTAFMDATIFGIFCKHIKQYFDQDWEDRTEKQRLLIERIFVLIRYTFAIGVESAKYLSVPEVDHQVRERVIVNFFTSGFDAVFLKLSGNTTEREFAAYIVAILALIFKTSNPLAIAQEGDERLKEAGKERFEREEAVKIELAKREEINKRIQNRRSFLSGTFVVKGLKSLNPDNDFVLRRPPLSTTNCGSDNAIVADAAPLQVLAQRKRPRNPPRNRRVNNLDDQYHQQKDNQSNDDMLRQHNLSPEAMLRIREFCWRLLTEGRYNKLMRMTKEMAFISSSRQQQQQKLNELHFLTLATFMMSFARHAHLSCQTVSLTFSVEFFHQLTSHLTNCFELMKTNRELVRKYALSAQHAISAFREQMIMLNSISNSQFAADKDYFTAFSSQMFQLEEYRELAGGILMHLAPAGATHRMLQDLIVANHYFLHVMEKCVKRGELRKVQKRKRQKRRQKAQEKRRQKQEKSAAKSQLMGPAELATLWEEISVELSDTLVGELAPNDNDDTNPIDMKINVDDDQSQAFALLKVRDALRTRRIADAVGIYRSARVLWPETGNFGDDEMRPEDEHLALHELFHADMDTAAELYDKAFQEAYGRSRTEEEANGRNMMMMTDDEEGDEEWEKEWEKDEEEHGDDDNNMGEEEEELKQDQQDRHLDVMESAFDFAGFVSAFAKPAVINWYIFCLRNYRTNPQEVNLAIAKFFHRVAFDLKSPARLYLATLFKVLLEIGKEVNAVVSAGDTNLRAGHPHFRLFEFGHHLLRKFFAHYAERQKTSAGDGGGGLLVCELLFSKSAREAYELEYGYGAFE